MDAFLKTHSTLSRPPRHIFAGYTVLGKLGNIVAETLCFLTIFHCFPTSGNIAAETKFAS